MKCIWTLNDYGTGLYKTGCGLSLSPAFKSPDDYALNYCVGCGKEIEVNEDEAIATEEAETGSQ